MKENYKNRPHLSTEQDIKLTKVSISQRLEKWRKLQSIHMPQVESLIQSQDPAEVEDEVLFLPSHFSESERARYSLTVLGDEEKKLREGHACEGILQLRKLMKCLSSMYRRKRKDTKGQKANTRSHLKIDTAEATRDQVLAVYNLTRKALCALGNTNDNFEVRYPRLTLSDLFRKSTMDKRVLGDTYRPDGLIWELLGISGASFTQSSSSSGLPAPPPVLADGIPHPTSSLSTSPVSPADQMDVQSETRDGLSGKLWSPTIGLTEAEVEEWEVEGIESDHLSYSYALISFHAEDRVQWHRAWAEMQRWMEEFEMKHAEFIRCIETFRTMQQAWGTVAKRCTHPGYAAFARRQSDMYLTLREDAESLFKLKGEPRFSGISDIKSLIPVVRQFRESELAWLNALVNRRF